MNIEELVVKLTAEIRDIVKPHLGRIASKASSGKAVGGDTTFVIDDIAEESTYEFLKKENNIAYYSEDRGLVSFGKPCYILIIDPIDGTRPAAAGFESCCVSIAVAPYKENPLISDIFFAVIQEIKTGTIFLAQKGKGVKIERNGEPQPLLLSSNENLSTIFWNAGFRGRPAHLVVAVLGDLINLSSVDGGFFELGSISFSLTRLVTGQLDACVDIGKRIIDEVDWAADEFSKVGRGTILNNNPYDVAAGILVVKEAGVVITDGFGKPVDDYPLLGSGLNYQFSLVAAANPRLHKKLITEVDKGISRLKELPSTLSL